MKYDLCRGENCLSFRKIKPSKFILFLNPQKTALIFSLYFGELIVDTFIALVCSSRGRPGGGGGGDMPF